MGVGYCGLASVGVARAGRDAVDPQVRTTTTKFGLDVGICGGGSRQQSGACASIHYGCGLMPERGVQQLVHLIENHDPDVRAAESAAAHQVHEPAGSTHRDVDGRDQRALVFGNRLTPHEAGDAQPGTGADRAEHLI